MKAMREGIAVSTRLRAIFAESSFWFRASFSSASTSLGRFFDTNSWNQRHLAVSFLACKGERFASKNAL